MGVAYAPIDDDIAPKPPSVFRHPDGKPIVSIPAPVSDNTECNYVVMFFVIGVFLIGITDAMRSK